MLSRLVLGKNKMKGIENMNPKSLISLPISIYLRDVENEHRQRYAKKSHLH